MSEEVLYPEDCIKVLNHGFVRLVEHMGNDDSIVQAARVSYGKNTKKINEDKGLIRYLLRHAHTTPLEMVEFKFHVRMPIFVARQWIRHRTANVNEYSGRYSEMPELFYVPEPERLTKQSTTNRQGSSDELVENPEHQSHLFYADAKEAHVDYKARLETGMSRELARICLPLSQYTEMYWKIDLHNLFHFLKLRLDSHAQYEIRVYGEAMAEMVKNICPIAWEAFEDYKLHSLMLSRLEIKTLSGFLGKELREALLDGRYTDDAFKLFQNKREKEEFVEKLVKIAKAYEG